MGIDNDGALINTNLLAQSAGKDTPELGNLNILQQSGTNIGQLIICECLKEHHKIIWMWVRRHKTIANNELCSR